MTTAKGLDDGPEYSPDGQFIYFNSERSGTMQIWRMKADGSETTQITQDEFNNWFPHLSPDGRKLSWISARWRPASFSRLTDGSILPVNDFFWIVPAILYEFVNPPAGFSTELTLKRSDFGFDPKAIGPIGDEAIILIDFEGLRK